VIVVVTSCGGGDWDGVGVGVGCVVSWWQPPLQDVTVTVLVVEVVYVVPLLEVVMGQTVVVVYVV
jgi:hypothetical protein